MHVRALATSLQKLGSVREFIDTESSEDFQFLTALDSYNPILVFLLI